MCVRRIQPIACTYRAVIYAFVRLMEMIKSKIEYKRQYSYIQDKVRLRNPLFEKLPYILCGKCGTAIKKLNYASDE